MAGGNGARRSERGSRIGSFRNPYLARLAPPHVAILFGAFVSDAHPSPVSKKSPALTTAQARQLAARAIEDELERLPDLAAILDYRQRRNHAAYCSHRKQTRLNLERRSKRRNLKIS